MRPLCKSGSLCLMALLAACRPVAVEHPAVWNRAGRVLAIDAVGRLREAFNQGACESIYGDASDAFRQLEIRDYWINECPYLRERLGLWTSFRPLVSETKAGFQAYLEGTALFATGQYHMRSTWNLENGRARLFRFELKGADRIIAIPTRSRKPRCYNPIETVHESPDLSCPARRVRSRPFLFRLSNTRPCL
jgi:hypothetical protein